MGRSEVVNYNIWNHALEFEIGITPPLANGHEKSRLQDLESCT